jgi:arabinogalactan endo-1,4-beta-galactosidase
MNLQKAPKMLSALGLAAIACCSSASPRDAASGLDRRREPFRVGLTVSEVRFDESTHFVDFNGKPLRDLTARQRFFRSLGATEVWARLSTRKQKTAGDLPHQLHMDDALLRARAAKKLGLDFYPELGFFGWYGDVTCQSPPDFSEYPDIKLPGAWGSLTIDQMAAAIRIYARDTARALLRTGVRVKHWKLGNEVNYGMAGIGPGPLRASTTCDSFAQAAGLKKPGDPPGTGWHQAPNAIDPVTSSVDLGRLMYMPETERIQFLQAHVWPHMAHLYAAAMEGIREVQPRAKFATHLAFASADFFNAFNSVMTNAGVHFDVMGISWYPTGKTLKGAGETVAQFKSTVLGFQNQSKIPIYVEELAFAFEPILNRKSPFYGWDQPNGQYKISRSEQARFLRNLVGWAFENGLAGVKYYGADAALPDLWLELSLFSLDEKNRLAIPNEGLKSFLEGLSDPQTNAEQFQ